MLLLIRLGYVTEKSIYEKACNIKHVKKTKKEEKELSETDGKSVGSLSTKTSQNPSRNPSRKQSEVEDRDTLYLHAIEGSDEKKKQLKKSLKKLINIKENPNFQITEMNSTMVRAIKETIQDIWASILSLTCPHCGTKPSSIKLDMNTKFLIETKSEKEKVGKVLHTKKGYENLSDDEDEDNEEDKERKETEKNAGVKKEVQQIFINPLEVISILLYSYQIRSRNMLDFYGKIMANS